jgi:chromosome segregation ATPase
MAEVKQSLEAIKEVVERRQQTDSEVKEGLKMSHEAIKGLQFDKIEIQNVLKKAQSDIAPVVDDVSKLKNRTASFLSQLETLGIKLDQYWATDEDIKITIQNIRSKQDTYEKLLALVAREKEVKDQSTEDRPASSQSSSSQGRLLTTLGSMT